MNKEEKKCIKSMKRFANVYDMTSVTAKEMQTILNLIEKLQKENEGLKSENRRLKVIRYSTEYGTENIHLITKSDLVQIDINKYMIEIEKKIC